MTIEQVLQKDTLPAPVELWVLDGTEKGGVILRFTNQLLNGANPTFGGNIYQALPFQTSGWDTSSEGTSPQPQVIFANVTKYLQSLCLQYNDFIRWRVTRFVTFEPYLDTGATPDGNAVFNVGSALVEQKTKQNKKELGFKLTMVVDAPNAMIPGEQVLRREFPGAGLFRK